MSVRHLPPVFMLLLSVSVAMGAEPTPEQTLLSAASAGNEARLRLLIDAGVDVNTVTDGWTALTRAAFSNRVDSVRLLLEAGADVTIGDSPPLEAAARSNNPEIVRMLIEHGATHTLCSAAGTGDVEALREFLAAGADVNAPGPVEGYAPLHLAAKNGHAEAIRLLIEAGATVDLRAKLGVTPLHEAVVRRKLHAAVALLEAGADIEAPVHGGWHFGTGSTCNRYRPLHVAASFGHPEMVRMLLDRGADPNGRAVIEGTREGPSGVGPPFELLEPPGLTPLHVAAYNAFLRYQWRKLGLTWEGMPEMLIAAGADVNARDGMGNTPLHRAAQGHLPRVKVLLDAGADPSIENEMGQTPVDVAQRHGREEIATALMGGGG